MAAKPQKALRRSGPGRAWFDLKKNRNLKTARF